MPPPTAKLRLLLLLPIVPALLAVAILVMLLVDRPIHFVNRPTFRIRYGGGRILITHVHANDSIGPSTEVFIDANSSEQLYKNYPQMSDWKNGLPRRYFWFLGIGYESGPKV